MKNTLDQITKKYNWILTKEEPNQLVYTRPTDETSFIRIIFNSESSISVSMPLKSKTYQYRSLFNSEDLASRYIEQRIDDLGTLQ